MVSAGTAIAYISDSNTFQSLEIHNIRIRTGAHNQTSYIRDKIRHRRRRWGGSGGTATDPQPPPAWQLQISSPEVSRGSFGRLVLYGQLWLVCGVVPPQLPPPLSGQGGAASFRQGARGLLITFAYRDTTAPYHHHHHHHHRIITVEIFKTRSFLMVRLAGRPENTSFS